MLIIDGAYLCVGSRELSKATGRKLKLTERTVPVLLDFMTRETGVPMFTHRHYVTAEHD
jgi:hypothetical protein